MNHDQHRESEAPEAPAPSTARHGGLAIVLTGGGARAAYQVGLLRGICSRWPDLDVSILTGVSAGAINVAYLASRQHHFQRSVDDLTNLWMSLTPEQVFRVDAGSLLRRMLSVGVQFVSGGSRLAPRSRGMVDTTPLASLLHRELGAEADSPIPGIAARLSAPDPLRAIAIGTIDWATGRSYTWTQGSTVQQEGTMTWRRSGREGQPCRLTVPHVLASSALPLLFPAVKLSGSWHGDGGVRLVYPLAPAVHLGADRILAISTRMRPPGERTPDTSGYPPPAQVAGVLMNAIFLDQLDQDAQRLERINHLLRRSGDPVGRLRHVDLTVIRPSEDLGRAAADYEFKLPRAFRFATRGLGTKETKSPDILAMLMFQPDYVSRLIEIGERDAETNARQIARILRR